MNVVSCTLAVVLLGAYLVTGMAAPQKVEGIFAGFIGDDPVWTDHYRMDGTKEIQDRIVSADGKSERTVMLYPGRVKEEIYTESTDGALGYNVRVNDEFVYVYSGQGMTGMIALEQRPLVFDYTVPTHYGVLLNSYSDARGGTQKITVVIPSKGDYQPIAITRKPSVDIPMGEGSVRAGVYELRIEYKVYVTVWALDAAVAAVYIPAQDEYMVDAKYPMLHEKIQMLVKRAM